MKEKKSSFFTPQKLRQGESEFVLPAARSNICKERKKRGKYVKVHEFILYPQHSLLAFL